MLKDLSLLEPALIQPVRIVGPTAWAGHIPFASWIIAKLNPVIFVELGTHTGNSYSAFCQSVQDHGLNTKCFAVDTWQGDEHAGHYDDTVFNELSEHHNNRYESFSRLLRMPFDEACSYFSDRSIDLLHIDGLHTYDAVKHDFETWRPKLSERGIVLFHDTNVRERDFGVWKLWEELCTQYPSLNFDHSNGLGVLFVGENIPEDIQCVLQAYQIDALTVKNLFAHLGQRITQQYELSIQNQAIVQRDGDIANLYQAIAQRDGDIANLYQAIAQRDGDIANLYQAIAQRDGDIVGYEETLRKIYGSHSWRITSPLRFLTRLFRKMLFGNS